VKTDSLVETDHRSRAPIALIVCLVVLVSAVIVAWLVQRDFGNVLALVIPLILLLLIQYMPLLAAEIIPLVGPGGDAGFVHDESVSHYRGADYGCAHLDLVLPTDGQDLSGCCGQCRTRGLDVHLGAGHRTNPGLKRHELSLAREAWVYVSTCGSERRQR
jgi:hypothetical protein